MPTEYFQDDELAASVGEVLQTKTFTEFNLLREQAVKFLCGFILKTTKEGESQPTTGDPVIVKKISSADQIFLEGHYKLYADKTRWDEASSTNRKAMLHRALMRIEVSVSEDNKVKLKARKPDVSEFQTTVSRFGAWTEDLIAMRDNLQAAATLKVIRKAGSAETRAQV